MTKFWPGGSSSFDKCIKLFNSSCLDGVGFYLHFLTKFGESDSFDKCRGPLGVLWEQKAPNECSNTWTLKAP